MFHVVFVLYCSLFCVSYSGSITSLWEERAVFLVSFNSNFFVSVRRGFPFPIGASDKVRYFIVALDPWT